MKTTNRIFSIMIGLVLFGIGFFSGSIYEIDKKKEVVDSELTTIQNEIATLNNETDWNALKNIEANTIVKPCNRCRPKVSAAFMRLDTRAFKKGDNVVVR